MNSPPAKRKSQHYTCTICGEGFLWVLELRAHKRKYKGPHKRPKPRPGKKSGNIVEAIEDLRAREYRGYRQTDRSS